MANYGEIGRGMTSDTWRWQAGGELFTYYGPPTLSSHLAAVGVELHDLTDTQDGWLISEEENSVDAALLRRDYRDHYRRTVAVSTPRTMSGACCRSAVAGRAIATSRWTTSRTGLCSVRVSRIPPSGTTRRSTKVM